MDVPAIPIQLGTTITDREPIVQHVRSAIDLIAAGGAQRVTLIGFSGAERLLPRVQILAGEAGLTARAVWQPDGDGCDITIERVR